MLNGALAFKNVKACFLVIQTIAFANAVAKNNAIGLNFLFEYEPAHRFTNIWF